MAIKGSITIYLNLFKHTDDEADETPHYRGKMDVGGKTYDLALWTNREAGEVPLHLSGQVTTVRRTKT